MGSKCCYKCPNQQISWWSQNVHAPNYPTNESKIRDKRRIYWESLDTTLTQNILSYCPSFITSKKKDRKGRQKNCSDTIHKNIMEWCPNCNHWCPNCRLKQCKGICFVTRNGAGNHAYHNCQKQKQTCNKSLSST